MAGLYHLPSRDAARLSGCDEFHPFSRLCALVPYLTSERCIRAARVADQPMIIAGFSKSRFLPILGRVHQYENGQRYENVGRRQIQFLVF
jgi:hypothetical protein